MSSQNEKSVAFVQKCNLALCGEETALEQYVILRFFVNLPSNPRTVLKVILIGKLIINCKDVSRGGAQWFRMLKNWTKKEKKKSSLV